MHERFLRFCWPAVALWAVVAAPARAYVALDRWNSTATDGSTGMWGTPATVTWSLAPDGTIIPTNAPSNLISFLDANWGVGPGGSDLAKRPWFFLFEQSFDRLSAVSGLTYVYEPNDDGVTPTPALGRSFSNAQAAGGELGVRGDVRIGGKSFAPENSTLAANYFPDYSEMMINTDQSSFYANSFENYRNMRNTIMHEAMHGLGVSHILSNNARFLIEPVITAIFDGPQLDDVLALQRLYGDALEKSGGNDSHALATPLGALDAAQPLVRGALGDDTIIDGAAIDFLSIDNSTDADYFSFTLAESLAVAVTVTPKGTTYQIGPESGDPQTDYNSRALNDLTLTLLDSSGVQPLGETANAFGAGEGESLVSQLGPGTYYARVRGLLDDVQLYQISIAGAAPAPADLAWVGNANGTWDVATTANFVDGDDPAVFDPGDNVAFTDDALTTTVVVAEEVSPGAVSVDTAGDYFFHGPGGVDTAQLTVAGSGSVVLANNGNALGAVDVQGGALTISGVSNAPISGVVHVAAGATLELIGDQLLAESARVTGGGHIVGNVNSPGTLAPGDSTATLNLDGNLTLSGESELEIELAGLAPGLEYDVLSVAGTAAIAGTLAASLEVGFVPRSGDSFTVLTGGAIIGAFTTLDLPDLVPGLLWQTTYLSDQLTLAVIGTATYDPADFNGDGVVDGMDAQAWHDGFGRQVGSDREDGDATGDGVVDGADFLVWQQRLNVEPSISVRSLETPEPRAWGLAVTAVMAAIGVGRRRTR